MNDAVPEIKSFFQETSRKALGIGMLNRLIVLAAELSRVPDIWLSFLRPRR
jgi:hypothetical protein